MFGDIGNSKQNMVAIHERCVSELECGLEESLNF